MTEAELTREQVELQQMVRQFADQELKPGAGQRDKAGEFPGPAVQRLQELGLLGLIYPAGYGGGGRDFVSYVVVVEELARRHGFPKATRAFSGRCAEGAIGGRRVLLLRPTTYMNESGRAVGALLRFYKIPVEQLLVMFDDLDLPFGAIRLRADGGAGGHNGMRSIIQHLSGNQFARLRIGIGRPPGRMDPAAFVLQDFNRAEAAELDILLDRAGQAIDTFLTAGITTAMNQFNTNPPRDRTT